MPETMVEEESKGSWKVIAAITLVGVVVVALLSGWALTKDTATPASVEQVHQLLIQQRSISARADCRAAINYALQQVKDDRFNLVLGVTFNHQPPGTPLTDIERAVIRDANAKVTALPSLPDAVDHGATINGEQFSPCPKV